MERVINLNSIKTPEQIKIYKTFKETESKLEELGKKLQGCDDQVNIDFSQNKGEVAVDSIKLKDSNAIYTGYYRFDPGTGKTEELNMESDLWPDKGAYNTNRTIRYRYKEDEREKKLEFHSEYYYENFGRDRSDYSFTVNKETGDINCNIRNVTDY